VAMPFTLKKSILKGKRKNYGKLKYFIMTKYNLKKHPLKETQNPSS
jgi:hypothetical protein